MSRHPRFEWRDEGAALTRLLGTDEIGDRLRRREPIAALLAADEADHAAWRAGRSTALLYNGPW